MMSASPRADHETRPATVFASYPRPSDFNRARGSPDDETEIVGAIGENG
jgi:hypothetical protein